jgi:acetylornithine deacetylase
MKTRFENSQIRFEKMSQYPGLHTDPASAVIAYTRSINPIDKFGDNVSFGTEAGLFDGIGINCVVCGPGSIDQAHKPDEFVSRQQIQHCDQMIENLVRQCHEPLQSG